VITACVRFPSKRSAANDSDRATVVARAVYLTCRSTTPREAVKAIATTLREEFHDIARQTRNEIRDADAS